MTAGHDPDHEYLTARELAALLRVRERKVYELAAAGEVPCSRATGKLLFRRTAVDAWLARASSGPADDPRPVPRAAVFAGSHDPLLEWALRECGAGLATYFDGSLDGVERFAAGGAVASALHVPGLGGGLDDADWNVPLVRERFGAEPVVLVAFARRRRGLIVAPEAAGEIRRVADLAGRRVVPRQAGAGGQVLFERQLAAAGLAEDAFERIAPARTESDAALAVAEGRADVACGLPGPARQLGLGFVPLVEERFDLLIERRAWFEPALQRLFAFCRTEPFARRAASLTGYDTGVLGEVRFNGEG